MLTLKEALAANRKKFRLEMTLTIGGTILVSLILFGILGVCEWRRGVQADKCEAKGGTFLIAANGGVCVKLERVR